MADEQEPRAARAPLAMPKFINGRPVDPMLASFNEMRAAFQNIYDRTGDLAVKAIIDRANEATRR